MAFRRNPARNWLWAVAALVLVAAALSSVPVAQARQYVTTKRISVSSTGVQGINIQHPVISANGKKVAFWSDREGLVPNDTNFAGDVFVHDLETNQTIRVSLGHMGVQTARSDGNLPNSYPEIDISDNGCIIVYSSDAMNITQQGGTQVPDVNNDTDVFAVNICTPGFPSSPVQTLHVSKRYIGSGGQQAAGGNTNPKISGNGCFILWRSSAANLVDGDTNNMPDIFMMDRCNSDLPISRVNIGNEEQQANLENGTNTFSVTDDGRYVAFESIATNLVAGDTNNLGDIFIRDRVAGTTIRIMGMGGQQPNGRSSNPMLRGKYAGDGLGGEGDVEVVFRSDASNLVPGDTNGRADIFVYNLNTGVIERLSVNSEGGQANAGSDHAYINDTGRYVTFYSDASNLVFGDTNGSADIFVRDRQFNITTRVSVRTNGNQANGPANRFSGMNAGGGIIVYESYASNIVADDTNNSSDVFVARGGPNSPNNLTMVDRGETFVSLTWDDNSNEDNFILQRRLDSQTNFSLLQTLAPNTTSYVDDGLVLCTIYNYRVLSLRDGIRSPSNIVRVKTTGCPPGEFRLLAPTTGQLVINPKRVEFRWSTSDEADYFTFKVFRASDLVNPIYTLAPTVGDICQGNRCRLTPDNTLAALLTNDNYVFTVVATNAKGNTPATNNTEGTFTVNTSAAPRSFSLTAPAHKTLVRTAENFPAFTWEDTRDADTYGIDVVQVSNNVRLGTVITHSGLTPASDADSLTCDYEARVCTYTPTGGELSGMSSGKYTWTVTAYSPAGTPSEATNGAFRFTLNTGDIEILQNGDFETDANGDKIPDGWTVAKASGDKLKCNKPDKTITIFGNCAFTFKGSSAEAVTVKQVVPIAGLNINGGDELYFIGKAQQKSLPANKLKIKITVKYVGNAFPKDKATVNLLGGTSDWANTPSANIFVDGAVEKIQVVIQNKAASGKATVDDLSLTLLSLDSPRRMGRDVVSSTEYLPGTRIPVIGGDPLADLLPPPPPAVPGFRGMN